MTIGDRDSTAVHTALVYIVGSVARVGFDKEYRRDRATDDCMNTPISPIEGRTCEVESRITSLALPAIWVRPIGTGAWLSIPTPRMDLEFRRLPADFMGGLILPIR